MKTVLIPLIGDPKENLYQLGLKEKEAFNKIEDRVHRLFSTNQLLRQGHELYQKTKSLLKKRGPSFFDDCIKAYSEGLGISDSRYYNLIFMFEMAAHFGQIYPELKSLLPGCTSVLQKSDEGVTHTRLLDFPLIDIFDAAPRLYYWQFEGKPGVLSYSCEGLAPLFLQALHQEGVSFALHYKPTTGLFESGQSIFEISFESLFKSKNLDSFKKEIRSYSSLTKWCFILVNKEGKVQAIDIDGPAIKFEHYDLDHHGQVIFTNIPLQSDERSFDNYLHFSSDRQKWIQQKLKKNSKLHMLDKITDLEDQKNKHWTHPAATLSTLGAYHLNLTKGFLDLKESEGVIVQSDPIYRFSLDQNSTPLLIKKEEKQTAFEQAWKRAAKAQSYFDQGKYDLAYHELQMAESLMPLEVWKNILQFYLCVWDFKFISNTIELSMVYKKVRSLHLPVALQEQWKLLIMRFEKKLGLIVTIQAEDFKTSLKETFIQEQNAPATIFTAWMKLLYPRLEILDVLTPHYQ
jgi:hypothetical protein